MGQESTSTFLKFAKVGYDNRIVKLNSWKNDDRGGCVA